VTLSEGTRLGPYEILAPLGAGGMGEVYRARDSKLDREVALKVLPKSLASDSAALARFEREAKAVAALSHPNILAIHDFGRDGDTVYAAMELLEGRSLRDLLDSGAMPLRTAMDYARQICEGLSAAHEKGVVHRDIKPENLFLTRDGRIKILDFGLAKRRTEPSKPGDSRSPTVSAYTEPGTVLGTVGYMSPEQVRGLAVDGRSDLFSLGCVLFEMRTGQRAFRGASVADTLSAILNTEPALPGSGPGPSARSRAISRLLARCLAKDPAGRWQCAGDLAAELERLCREPDLDASGRGSRARRAPGWTGAAYVAAGIAAALAAGYFLGHRGRRGEARPLPPTRFALEAPAGHTFSEFTRGGPSVSPDGRSIVFGASNAVESALWLQRFDGKEARRLAGTADARFPFWSPDGSQIGYFVGDKLERLELATGDRHVVCDVPFLTLGASWTANGAILFAAGVGRPIMSVSARGGPPRPATRISAGETFQAWPEALPEGNGFLYRSVRMEPEASPPYRSRLMAASSRGQSRELRELADTSRMEFVPPDLLLYVRGQRLMASRFDAAGLRLSGEPVVLAEPVPQVLGRGDAPFSAGGNLIVYNGAAENEALTWFDRQGQQLSVVAKPGATWDLTLSPDGAAALFSRLDLLSGAMGIWRVNTRRGGALPLTGGPGSMWSWSPVFSPDGRRMAFVSVRLGLPQLFIQDVAPDAQARLVRRLDGLMYPADWTPDGRSVIFQYRPAAAQQWNVWRIDADGQSEPVRLTSSGSTSNAKVSPGGDLLAFAAAVSGESEIFLQPYPDGGDRIRVSTNGGFQPIWARDGSELYFIGSDSSLYAVKITRKPRIDAGQPTRLFHPPLRGPLKGFNYYDVSRDGRRFLVNALAEGRGAPARVVMGWRSLLGSR
jgi:Tol biopolymer transport system component